MTACPSCIEATDDIQCWVAAKGIVVKNDSEDEFQTFK
jgi:hypothetical protein